MGGGGSTSSTVQKSDPWWGVQGPLLDYVGRAETQSRQPYTQYEGQRVAGFAPEQEQALQLTKQRALSGSPVMNQAQAETQKTLGGGYLDYSSGTNPYMGQTGGTNAYAGSNPYLEGVLQNTLGDVSRGYATGTAANTSAAAARANAFGSSGHDQLATMQAGELAKQLGGISSGVRMQDYGMQQQLAESALARQQQDLARNAGLSEAGLGRDQQAYLAERARMMQANLFAPQMAASDYTDISALSGVGQARQAMNQSLLDVPYQNYMAQQQWPYQQLDSLRNALTAAQGGTVMGSSTGPGTSQLANIAGLGMTGLGAYNMANTAGLLGGAGAAGAAAGAYNPALIAALAGTTGAAGAAGGGAAAASAMIPLMFL